jgi:hypothetical protein
MIKLLPGMIRFILLDSFFAEYFDPEGSKRKE